MSKNLYKEKKLFCEEIHMKKPKIKITIHAFPGICFGVLFPMDYYTDVSISILCFNITFKWRKR